jgi:adenosylmethionine-8-amino-7-oxononanoate aminotransferase
MGIPLPQIPWRAQLLASMELLLQNETQMNIKRITHQHSEFIKVLAQHPQVEKARHIGTIMAFDFKTGQGTSYFNEIGKKLYNEFLQRGIIMRPLGNVLYLVPPFCISEEELDFVYQNILEVLDQFRD